VKALVDRAVTLNSHEGDLVEVCHYMVPSQMVLLRLPQAVCSAFELKTPEDRLLFVPCVLHLTTLKVDTLKFSPNRY